MLGTFFIVLLSVWCAIVNGESSNDLHSVVRDLQHEMSSLKITLIKQNDIIEKQNFNIEKQDSVIKKMSVDIEDLHKNEAKLHKDFDKMSADCKKSEQMLKLEIGDLRKDLQKMKRAIESRSTTMVGKIKESPVQSCKWLRENSKHVTSGFFWVSLKNTKVYCDMDKENDGGGWTMVGQAEAQTDSEGKQIGYEKIMSNNIENLSNVDTKRFLLSGKALRELRNYINFTQIRFYCHKPWHGRTLHIYTSMNDLGEGVVKLMTGKSSVRPKSCNSYVRMNDDSSNLASHCESWYEQKWYDNGGVNARMYSNPMWIYGRNRFNLFGNYILCDDNLGQPGFNKIGRWVFYVR